ncbi:uncharacterized protein LOC111707004 isoform X2 [Eurytemora carolleeae]|uniref:uncharacterized protein LOC111707004 isoform X2 n=1 Tax=Eurytemora carolleeae TaxID=1294199 RepID=UPI000C79445A|nr:uncharacterized protein LOC111707004 isoform X2 [Eurytemora carolleeae]|eukprot:XP_023335743.1 uncharacterized protein LOC111707004 isoform X2 [Eurytemora affinis]
MDFMVKTVFLLLIIKQDCNLYILCVPDYWSEDYDQGKNCQDEDLIVKIEKKEVKGFCEAADGNLSDSQVFHECKLSLGKTLAGLCGSTAVEEAGKLLFCKNDQRTMCCSSNFTCVENWLAISDHFIKTAVDFLKDQKKWLEKEKTKGYESCHSLNTSLDASICQQDCEKYEKSTFATNCKKDGGFFKCCIRRDKANCHECRFCCTMLMCTMNTDKKERHTVFSNYIVNDNNTVDSNNISSKQEAQELFYLTSILYKAPDYRCLNPTSEKDATKWGAYDPTELVNAKSKEELDKVKTYPFDKRFMNYEDPEILKLMTDLLYMFSTLGIGKNKKRNWKETYGVDHASKNTKQEANKVLLDCVKAENSKFAKKCRKNNGLFKCCLGGWNLTTFHDTRKYLKKLKLISSVEEDLCADDNCFVNVNVHFCATRNSESGLVNLEFKTPLANPLGGGWFGNAEQNSKLKSESFDLRLGSRVQNCQYLDTCAPTPVAFDTTSVFLHAYDRDSFCDLGMKDVSYSISYKSDETKEECMKRKYPNIRICPKEKFDKKANLPERGRIFTGAMETLWKENKKKNVKNKKNKKTQNAREKNIREFPTEDEALETTVRNLFGLFLIY